MTLPNFVIYAAPWQVVAGLLWADGRALVRRGRDGAIGTVPVGPCACAEGGA